MSIIKHLSILIIFTTFIILSTKAYAEPQPEMKVHFIDVGQGDSILIETPSNKIILIDGGPPKAGKTVIAYLKSKNIEKIDILIATHPDIDHIGGLPDVMKSIKIDRIIDSGKLHTTRAYLKYINQIRKQKIPVNMAKENERIRLDPMINIQILNSYERMKNNNQSSIVLKVSYDEVDFLLMGDVEREQEKALLETKNMQAEIIKIAHHGSKTSSSFSFLQKVKPKVALITYSKKNEYGHPVSRVIESLNKVNAHIYSTAVFGNVVITTDGKGYFILPEKSPTESLTQSG